MVGHAVQTGHLRAGKYRSSDPCRYRKRVRSRRHRRSNSHFGPAIPAGAEKKEKFLKR
ncbi:hypothetical protein U2A4042280041 [Corynebacterium striatum]|nr:hypothetical protein U2A4042280041 [Corynebacterium striatum]